MSALLGAIGHLELAAITNQAQSAFQVTLIELFELDMTNLPGGTIVRFHNGVNFNGQPIVWQGNAYTALPIEASGFDFNAKGVLPRPKFRIANVDGLFSSLVMEYGDLVGCKVIRKQTYAKYLDAVNFPGGVNPDADPFQHFDDDVWYVDRKTAENKYVIEWELASAFDLQGITLPVRQIIQNTCSWKYKSAECGWVPVGIYYDRNDAVTTDPTKDFCSKRVSGCKARFQNNTLPYGGFPGAIRYD